jgi:hypothetical protein
MTTYFATEQQAKSWSVPFGWMGYSVESMQIPEFGAETVYQYGKILPVDVLIRMSYPFSLRAPAKQQLTHQDELPPLPSDSFYHINFKESSWDFNYIVHGAMLSAGVHIISKKGPITPAIIGFGCYDGMMEFQMIMKKTPGLAVQETSMGPSWTGCSISGYVNRYSLNMAFGVGMDAKSGSKKFFAAANEKLINDIATLIMTTGGDIISPNRIPVK